MSNDRDKEPGASDQNPKRDQDPGGGQQGGQGGGQQGGQEQAGDNTKGSTRKS